MKTTTSVEHCGCSATLLSSVQCSDGLPVMTEPLHVIVVDWYWCERCGAIGSGEAGSSQVSWRLPNAPLYKDDKDELL